MAAIQDLLKRVTDADLRARLEEEFNRLNKQKKFGLVFEEHLPECTPLYGVKIRVGTIVATKIQDGGAIFKVKAIDGDKALCVGIQDGEDHEFNLDDLVAVARFGDPIYPILEKVDEIEHGGGDLWHALIQADNYHALQLLEYLYPGKVDCIYIDPPYNTGAKDWKYNNDYVDENDAWRHSKWLSMMQRRLALAKKLLNPNDSVLIVTIDEKEYLHLGMLLEQMFPEARIQMISSIINPGGTGRANEFTRVNEYLYMVMMGVCAINSIDTDDFSNKTKAWDVFRRHNKANTRDKTLTQFYPIYINPKTLRIEKIGDPIPKNMPRESVPNIDGCVTTFPIRDDGTEMMWGLTAPEARRRNEKGYIKVNSYTPNRYQKFAIQHLMQGAIDDIDEGLASIVGRDKDGSVIIDYPNGKDTYMKNQWSYPWHNARSGGTEVLKHIIGARFSYPKSLFAVYDCIRMFEKTKPDALIVDFFAGSGTTLHAVNLLNAEDGGRRRCILVTNNEVSAKEAEGFVGQGLRPGDIQWEKRGIAQYVTWPRTVNSIKGVNLKGDPLKDDYGVEVDQYIINDEDQLISKKTGMPVKRKIYQKTKKQIYPQFSSLKRSDGFQSNAIFFKLGFVNPTAVSLGRAFKDILPVLWMKAGAVGRCPVSAGDKDMLVLPENKMAILKNEAAFAVFKDQVKARTEIRTVYLVTDFEPAYKSMAKAFHGCKTYQIYRDYLDNFRLAKTR